MVLALDGNDLPAVSEWHDRIEILAATSRSEHWTIPAYGEIPTLAAAPLRPDGYAASASEGPDAVGLPQALIILGRHTGLRQILAFSDRYVQFAKFVVN